MLFRKISFYLAIAGVVAALLLVRKMQQKPKDPGPVSQPARSMYEDKVAATGLVESSRENVKIASPKAALVTQVFVKVGDRVKRGAPLFQLDDREARARFATSKAQLASAQAALASEEVALADWSDQLERYTKLAGEKVATDDELKRRQFGRQAAQARVALAQAQVGTVRQQSAQAQVDVDVLTVIAPRDGQILQMNVREGEFAPAAAMAGDPLMMLGDVDTLQVRAEVDEQNASLVDSKQPAHASLKGHPEMQMPLRFVRVEPYVVPKRSLTGDSLERVDTRVLQIIFEFERPKFPVFVGQQVDVFIQRPSTPAG